MTSFEKNDMVFDALLKIAVTEAYDREIGALPNDEELGGYHPSPVLDRRVAGLIRSGSRKLKARHFMKGLGKTAAVLCILLTVSSAALMSVGATRNAILNALVKWHENYTEIQFGESSESDIDRPTYLPEGFSEKTLKSTNNSSTIIYEDKSGGQIFFIQQKGENVTTVVDNEHTDYTEIQISGKTGYLFKAKTSEDSNMLVWENNGVVFSLTSTIDSSELIQMAGSLKK